MVFVKLFLIMMVHAFNPMTWEANAKGSLSSWLIWFTELLPEQLRLNREINKQTNKNLKFEKWPLHSTL